MKLLREYVRELLAEAAKSVDNLPMGVTVSVEDLGDGYVIQFADFNGDPDNPNLPIKGVLEAYDPDESTGPCDNALVVRRAFVDQGWGPLLYDIIIELAGTRGVTMDRDTLSPAAFKVWDFYLNRRSDVNKVPLTDCLIDDKLLKYTKDYEEGKSPLHYRYVKNSTETLDALRLGARLT